jgi:hypothetical protein
MVRLGLISKEQQGLPSQAFRGWSNAEAPPNMYAIFDTLETGGTKSEKIERGETRQMNERHAMHTSMTLIPVTLTLTIYLTRVRVRVKIRVRLGLGLGL